MGPAGLPLHVEQFIQLHIESVEQLEILLHLRLNPTQSFSPDELATALRINSHSAGLRLADLLARRLLEETTGPRYRYLPATPDLTRDVDALASEYSQRRVSIINLIFSKPAGKIRTFADAFKFRKD